jgi:hypothetical protein
MKFQRICSVRREFKVHNTQVSQQHCVDLRFLEVLFHLFQPHVSKLDILCNFQGVNNDIEYDIVMKFSHASLPSTALHGFLITAGHFKLNFNLLWVCLLSSLWLLFIIFNILSVPLISEFIVLTQPGSRLSPSFVSIILLWCSL